MDSLLAYRALFNWTTPLMFVTTLFAGPFFEMLFFTELGQHLAVYDNRWFVLGNALLGSSVAGIFGGAMAVGNERRFGTLELVLGAPASTALTFVSRATPYIVNGFLVAVVNCAAGVLIFSISMTMSSWGIVVAALACSSASCAMFGILIGSVGLRLRDVFVIANLAAAALLLLSGVNVDTSNMPFLLRVMGQVLPVHHAVAAMRAVLSGHNGTGDLGFELLLAVTYGGLAAVLLAFFDRQSRRHATLGLL
jgi:ABC-2 type transport system permease protein